MSAIWIKKNFSSIKNFLSEIFFCVKNFFVGDFFYLTVQRNFCKIISELILLNVFYELGDLKFVWDGDKAEKNWQKHKVRFENAVRVFFDDNSIDEFDEILVVIYTERGDRNRIISARYATKGEEADYYGQFY